MCVCDYVIITINQYFKHVKWSLEIEDKATWMEEIL